MLELNGVGENEFVEYKNRPLVRQGNDIFYGDLSEEYHVYMMIMSDKPSNKTGESVPDKIMVQLRKNGTQMPAKQTLAHGIVDALDTAAVWLERYNK